MDMRIIQILFLAVHCICCCAGYCTEEDKFLERSYIPEYYDDYDNFVEGRYISLVSDIAVNCYGVDLPVALNKTKDINYDCENCTQTLSIVSLKSPVVPSGAFKDFSTFLVLRMSGLHITELKPGAFSSLHSLKELYLGENRLTTVKLGIFNSLSNLEVLDLSKNEICNISTESLTGMIHLNVLNLSSNHLVVFHTGIIDENVIQMEHIDLSFNLLSHVNNDRDFLRIGSVDLSSNNISVLNFCFFDIEVFNISKNNLTLWTNVSCSAKSNKIVDFDASYNNISHFESGIFSNLTNLESIKLQYNNISSIATGLFFEMKNLVHLNLSHNQLRQFQHGTFGGLEKLQSLDISYNKITTLRRYLHPLVSLKYLYIQGNKITYLNGDQLLRDLPSVSSISMENNIFYCDNLLELIHSFKEKRVDVAFGETKSSSNIHGISCSDDKNSVVYPTDMTNDVRADFEHIVTSKLQQLAGGDFEKAVVNDYFNNDFKNSNFYKYLENLHKVDLMKFNESALYNYFNNDFENSKFYKYLESMKDNNNFSVEFMKSVFRYFDRDFENSNFVKYLNSLKKAGDELYKGFPNSQMYSYFNEDFKNSNLYKYLENMENIRDPNLSNYTNSFNAGKYVNILDENKNQGVVVTIMILLVVLVLLKVTRFYKDSNKKSVESRENVELFEA